MSERLFSPEQRNVGGYDRVARALLAVSLTLVGLLALTANSQLLAVAAFLAAAGLAFNALSGFCGVNAVLGIDTCNVDSAKESEPTYWKPIRPPGPCWGSRPPPRNSSSICS